MKIYTKTGDQGFTSLLGGARVPKYDLKIEAYGVLDELNSYIGLLASLITSALDRQRLLEIQDRIFTIGSLLTVDDKVKIKLPELSAEDVFFLEKAIDEMTLLIPPLKHFILPGGHVAAAHCHIARCICRKAERIVVELIGKNEIEGEIIIYLNRLSDYLFVLARKINCETKTEETKWIPR